MPDTHSVISFLILLPYGVSELLDYHPMTIIVSNEVWYGFFIVEVTQIGVKIHYIFSHTVSHTQQTESLHQPTDITSLKHLGVSF
jgi:hypothetical protein